MSPGTNLNLNLSSGNNITIPNNVNLSFDNGNTNIYGDGTNLYAVVNSPGEFKINAGTVINGSLSVNGNINISGGTTTNFTTEYLTWSSGTLNPAGSTNTTFIYISNTNTNVTGQIGLGVFDGFIKIVTVIQLGSGSSYTLTFQDNSIIAPGNGATTARTVTFKNPGSSIMMIWNNTALSYIMLTCNAFIS